MCYDRLEEKNSHLLSFKIVFPESHFLCLAPGSKCKRYLATRFCVKLTWLLQELAVFPIVVAIQRDLTSCSASAVPSSCECHTEKNELSVHQVCIQKDPALSLNCSTETLQASHRPLAGTHTDLCPLCCPVLVSSRSACPRASQVLFLGLAHCFRESTGLLVLMYFGAKL